MIRRKGHLLIVWMLMVSLWLVSCQKKPEETRVKGEESIETKQLEDKIPTLFVHGYKGNKHSFGGVLKRLEKAGVTEKQLILTVDESGNVTSQSLSPLSNRGSIQVLFQNNQNNEWNQALWLKNCLVYLKEKEGIQQVNLVGHSMGGVSSLRYLITYGQETDLPIVKKVISIGSPFNAFIDTLSSKSQTLSQELTQGPSQWTDAFKEYEVGMNQLAVKPQFLLLVGQLSDKDLSDGTVPVSSGLSIYSFLKEQGYSVNYQIIHGKKSQHSLLHENKEVDQQISQFLWP